MSRFARRFWAAFGVIACSCSACRPRPRRPIRPTSRRRVRRSTSCPRASSAPCRRPSTPRDQLLMYDGLTPLKDNVTAGRPAQPLQEERVRARRPERERACRPFPARPDLVVTRDSFNVPHIEAPTRDDVMYGIGFVTAEDRGLLMDTFRGPGRVAALDVPGLNPFQLAQSFQPLHLVAGRPRTSSRRRSTSCSRRTRAVSGSSTTSTTTSPGINAYRTLAGNTGAPWNRNDVIACAALIAAVFGKGGGDEARRAQLLSALKDRLGDREGEQVWNDLRELKDPETSVSIDGKFKQQAHKAPQPQGQRDHRRRQPRHVRGRELGRRAGVRSSRPSNALLVGARAVRDRAPALRGGPAGRLLLPAGADGDRRARRRHRRARRDVPRRRPVRRAGPRQGLLVERNLRGQRQHRHLRRGAVR